MVILNVINSLLKVQIQILIDIRSQHKELNSEQQLELKCEIPSSMVYDYLKCKCYFNVNPVESLF